MGETEQTKAVVPATVGTLQDVYKAILGAGIGVSNATAVLVGRLTPENADDDPSPAESAVLATAVRELQRAQFENARAADSLMDKDL